MECFNFVLRELGKVYCTELCLHKHSLQITSLFDVASHILDETCSSGTPVQMILNVSYQDIPIGNGV